jgi:hypothetical protein
VRYLDETPQVDGVAGLHLIDEVGRLYVRVPGHRRIITPADYARQPPVPDCVGVVRRAVVEEWLTKRTDYYAMEAHAWLTFSLRHNMLYVDEPWTKYHVTGDDRVSLVKDDRRLDDYLKFIDEHGEYIERVPCAVLDAILQQAWIDLKRARRSSDAKVVADCLRLRSLPYRSVPLRRALTKARAKLLRGQRELKTYYLT